MLHYLDDGQLLAMYKLLSVSDGGGVWIVGTNSYKGFTSYKAS